MFSFVIGNLTFLKFKKNFVFFFFTILKNKLYNIFKREVTNYTYVTKVKLSNNEVFRLQYLTHDCFVNRIHQIECQGSPCLKIVQFAGFGSGLIK